MDQKAVAMTARRMADARARLIRDSPFFGHLAMGLQLACGPCGTACTDGEKLVFDPDFAEKLQTDREMEFVILHEVLHCVLEHCTRGGTRDANLYNISCDIVVNSTILEMWGLQTIRIAGEEPIHLAPDEKEGRIHSAEEIYRMLLANGAKDPQNAPASGSVLDRHDVWQGIKNQERVRDTWNRRIRNAAQSCQAGVGLTPSIRELVKKLRNRSKVDWRQLLHDFLQHDTFDYSFLPPDRRCSGDFFLPAFNVDDDLGSARDLWACVDTSGSISDEQLAQVLLEIRDAMRQAGLSGKISFFDGEITDPEPFTTEEEFQQIKPMGGGGTSYHVIFRYLQEKLSHEPPRAILIYTDGYVCQWPEEVEAMGVPVLWLICEGGNANVPWGQVAELQ